VQFWTQQQLKTSWLGGWASALPLAYKKPTMKILFIRSAAPIGFAYYAGQEAEVSEVHGKELIETGYAEEIKRAVEAPEKEIKKAVKK